MNTTPRTSTPPSPNRGKWLGHAWVRKSVWWQIGSVVLATHVGMMWLDYGGVRWDMTTEKRFTMGSATKELLAEVRGPLDVSVYLSGALPSGFMRLQKETLGFLRELQAHAEVRIRMMPPSPASGSAQQQYFLSLNAKGIQPTHLRYEEDGKESQQWIFPGVLLRYGLKEQSVMLLQSKARASAEESLNSSIENLEYNITKGIAQLIRPISRRIGVVGALDLNSLESTRRSLGAGYVLEQVGLEAPLSAAQMPLLMVFPMATPYGEVAKYHLDQYLMQGGKAVVFAGGVHVNIDSLSEQGHLAIPFESGLEDLLFNYGLRIRKELIEDLYCAGYPVVMGQFGTQPQIGLVPWPFFVSATPTGAHPIVRNLDHVLLRFCSPIDTVYAPGVQKTPLLQSSIHTRIGTYPRVIGLNLMQKEAQGLRPEHFELGTHTLAYLIQGTLSSPYAHRPPPYAATPLTTGATQLIVIGTPYFLHSDQHPQHKRPSELGMYWPENKRYGNAAMLEQALMYLQNPGGLILNRNKQVIWRPLDKIKTAQVHWKWLNLGIPLLWWAMVGAIAYFVRIQTYRSQ